MSKPVYENSLEAANILWLVNNVVLRNANHMNYHRKRHANGIWFFCLSVLLMGLWGGTDAFAYGRLKVDSRPQGAKVMVEGSYLGRTPLNLELNPGRWQIELRKRGYIPLVQTVGVRPGRSREILLELQPIEKTGFLDIVSTPSPAKIFLNGVSYQQTPRRIALKPGDYRLRLEKENHMTFKDQIRISPNRTLQLHTKLEPQMVYNTVTIASNPSGARVFISDRYYDVTPTRIQLMRGGYHVKIEKDGFHSQTQDLRVGPRQANHLTVDLLPVHHFGVLKIETQPAGARVFIDGAFVAKAPVSTRLLAGRHEVKIRKKGFVTFQAFVAVQAGDHLVRRYDLESKAPPVPRKGTLRVTSYPEDAKVLVNDQKYGRTPLEIDLPPGSYRIVIRKRGFEPYREQVTIGSKQLYPLRIQMAPKQREIVRGTLKVRSNPNGKVFVDGHYIGQTPVKLPLEAGLHQVKIRRKGYRPYRADVTMTDGHLQRIVANLEPRQLTRPQISQVLVASRPERAKIFINQRFYGTTPLTIELPEGRYLCEVRHRDFVPFQQDIEVYDGKPVQINASLQWRGAVSPEYILKKFIEGVLTP